MKVKEKFNKKKNMLKIYLKYNEEDKGLLYKILSITNPETIIIKGYKIEKSNTLLSFLKENNIRYVPSILVDNGCYKDVAFMLKLSDKAEELLKILFTIKTQKIEIIEKNALVTWESFLLENRYIMNMKRIIKESNGYIKANFEKKTIEILYNTNIHDYQLITNKLNLIINRIN